MKSLLSCIALLAGFCLAADSPYGVCAHLQRWEYDRASEELKLMKAGGIDHVRFDLDWDALETAPGVWNFDKMDSLAAMARENGIRILPILAYDVKWATPAWKHLPEFLNYVETAVRRYGDVMPCVEIWNEPNLPGFWRGKPSGTEYASLLVPAYRKIKELNPGITVAYGGTSLIPLDYIEESFKAGAAQAMDVMCIHPYRCNEMPEEYLPSDLAALRKLMDQYGAGDKPVWFSEMGYSTVERLPYLSLLLPRLFAALEMEPQKTTCVIFRDAGYRYDSEGLGFRIQDELPSLKAVRPIALKELKRLAAGTDTLLVLPDNESFPSEFLPDLIGYLRRGGRLTPLAAKFAHLVKAFPVMEQTDDGRRLGKLAIARSFKKAIAAVAADFEGRGVGEGYYVSVSHADNPDQAAEALAYLEGRLPGCRFGLFELGPAFITQGGPSCIAVQAVDLGACPGLDLS